MFAVLFDSTNGTFKYEVYDNDNNIVETNTGYDSYESAKEITKYYFEMI